MMKSENLPAVCVRLVVVDRKNHLPSVCRVQRQTSDGGWWTEFQQEWPSGRPTPDEWLEVQIQLTLALRHAVVDPRGLQEVLRER